MTEDFDKTGKPESEFKAFFAENKVLLDRELHNVARVEGGMEYINHKVDIIDLVAAEGVEVRANSNIGTSMIGYALGLSNLNAAVSASKAEMALDAAALEIRGRNLSERQEMPDINDLDIDLGDRSQILDELKSRYPDTGVESSEYDKKKTVFSDKETLAEAGKLSNKDWNLGAIDSVDSKGDNSNRFVIKTDIIGGIKDKSDVPSSRETAGIIDQALREDDSTGKSKKSRKPK
jgi:hypothetical protein